MTANNFHVCSTCCGTLLTALQILLLVVPLQSSSTADTLTCSFESDTCFWVPESVSAWQRRSAPYLPRIGPRRASEGQLFLSLTALSYTLPLKDFEAVSGFFENTDGSLQQFLFDYYLFHQSPSDMGSLVLQFLDGATSAWMDLWSASSVEGADWVPAAVDLPAHAVRLRFIGTTGRSLYTSIGVDALRVNVLAPTSTSLDAVGTTSTAPTLTSTTTVPGYEVLGCDFEDDSCGWVCQSFTGAIVPFQLLDIDGWCMAYSHVRLQMSPCHASSDVQRWYMLNGGYIKPSVRSSACLDHDIDTGNLAVETCHGGTNQQWYRDDALRLRSLHDHRCVELNRASRDLVLSNCTSASTQKFNTVERPDGVVTPSCAWNQISDGTPTSHTGPSAAISGSRYMYLEASGWNHPSQEFTLESPVFEEGNGFSRFVYFSYHIYIDAVGSLKLQSYNGTNWTTEWALFGDQGDAWHQAFVALPDSTQAVRFLGKTGGTFRGDISLDAVGTTSTALTLTSTVGTTSTAPTLTSTTTVPGYEVLGCDFEDDSCGWVCQSFTGAIVPFQLLDIDGWCMALYYGRLQMIPCHASSVVQRWYMLNGGYIKLSVRTGDCLDHDIDTGNLAFENCDGGTNQQWYRDDALRLRSLHDHRCVELNRASRDLVLSNCTSASTQKFNTVERPDGVVTPSCAWNQISDGTPTSHAGPSAAISGSRYMYLEASGWNHPSQEFTLESPVFEEGNGFSRFVYFSYHMYIDAMGSLKLQSYNGTNWTTEWALFGDQGDAWHQAFVALPDSTQAVRFLGKTGGSFRGDISLDAVGTTSTALTLTSTVGTTSTAPTLTSTTTVPGYEVLGCDFEDDSCGWVCQSFTGAIVPFQLLDIDGWCMALYYGRLQMIPCHASFDVQRWYMLNGGYIKPSVRTSACLDHDIDTGNLAVETCHGGTNQQWYRDDALRLRSLHDHRCVELNRASRDLVLSNCTSASTQKFNTVERPDGVVTPSCAWNQISDGTPTSHTGPSAAISGSRYMYLEASGWNHPSQEFTLESPVFEEGNGFSRFVYFSYHMYIDAMGSLKLQSYNGTNWTTEWALFGDQGDAWHQAFVALPDSTQAVRFLGKTGGTSRGDISLDAVGTSSSSSTFTTSTMTTTTSTTTMLDFSEMACGFETGLCLWAGSEAWLTTEEPVPWLQSGPNAAFEGKRYVFLRASGNFEKEFFLESSGFLNSAGALRHMHFSYFLFRLDSGSLIHDVGSLTLQSWDGTSWIDLWTPGVAQAAQWQRAVVPVPAKASRLRFRAVTGTTKYSNIALDAVATTLSGYDILDCGFETDTCGYYAAVAGEVWLRQAGPTPSSSTGPSSASEGQYYMFVEASGSTTKPKTLILDSPFFTQGDGEWRVLSFSYHMYSSVKGTMGSLELQQYNGEWAVLWSVSDTQGDMWHRVNVSLPEDTQAVRFLGMTLGDYRSDIAIDDVKTLTMVPTTSTTTARVHSYDDVSCGFESDTCEWKADEAWKRVADSNAGPARAVGRHYMYLDARGKDNVTGFVLESARFMPADDVDFDRYLHFSYHLFGNVEDSLILLAWDGTNWTAAWSESGQQLHAWRKATVYLQNTTEILRFVAVARGGPGSLIAIDEVRTGYEVVACDFETDACGWMADGQAWLRSASLGSALGSAGLASQGHYMYVAASASDEPNKEFKLESANFSRGDGSPRHFYHLDAGNVASLILQSWDGADWSNLWYRHGSAGDVWHLAHPQLPPTTQALRFVGIIRRNSSGVAANIAIDTLRTGEQDYDSISCGFEADACGWESLNWQRTSGSEAPTITGPSAASSDSLFMLGSPTAVLESMVFSESSRVARGLRFSYHIYHVLYDVAPTARLGLECWHSSGLDRTWQQV